ncbi:YacL family protein [Xenorhabdus bovienii]|uniref:YacL family protein n=1 Tax=Xenorhabdus bovienii TaxID=40576 RepID=UPI001EDCE0D8|nr:YacL family protein [Xenorhabdus bovienii]MCG3469064.1 YacL family protein [Xenorhabdus bovienii]
MKFMFDKQGYPLIDIEYEYHVLADFLRGDIQGSLFGVNEFITACNDVSSGNSLEWEGTGNAHTVTIRKEGVHIFNEYTGEELDIPTIDEFKHYLEGWKALLLTKNKME